jgi:DNA-binding NarL/FixJ family response regulator
MMHKNTPRDLGWWEVAEIFGEIDSGLSDEEIAGQYGIATKTVYKYQRNAALRSETEKHMREVIA